MILSIDTKLCYPCQDAQSLLAYQACRQALVAIKKHSRSKQDYEKLYLTLINNLAGFLQRLPEARYTSTNSQATWLESTLLRATAALRLRHHMRFPLYGLPEDVQEHYQLWSFTVFSSSLLWQLGKVATNLMVDLCNQQGEVSSHWQPMLQSLGQATDYYKIRNLKDVGGDAYKQLTLALAQNLMPEAGMHMIAMNREAFAYWLDALVQEGEGSAQAKLQFKLLEWLLDYKELPPEYQHLIDLKTWEELLAEQKELAVLFEQSPDYESEGRVAQATKLGEEFWQWLKRGLENGTISCNQANSKVSLTNEGLILAIPEIFQDYAREFHRFSQWQVIFKQFNALGISKRSGDDTWFGKFFVDTDKTAVKGKSIIIQNTSLVTPLNARPSLTAPASLTGVQLGPKQKN